ANDFRAAARNQTRQRLARQKCSGEIDDVGVAEKIVEERLDGVLRVGPAKLKKDHGDLFRTSHRSPSGPHKVNAPRGRIQIQKDDDRSARKTRLVISTTSISIPIESWHDVEVEFSPKSSSKRLGGTHGQPLFSVPR